MAVGRAAGAGAADRGRRAANDRYRPVPANPAATIGPDLRRFLVGDPDRSRGEPPDSGPIAGGGRGRGAGAGRGGAGRVRRVRRLRGRGRRGTGRAVPDGRAARATPPRTRTRIPVRSHGAHDVVDGHQRHPGIASSIPRTGSTIAVSVNPGQTALTTIPRAASPGPDGPHEVDHGRLVGGVDRVHRHRCESREAGQHDDPAPTTGTQRRQGRGQPEDHAVEVDAHRTAVRDLVETVERHGQAVHPRIQHDEVQPPNASTAAATAASLSARTLTSQRSARPPTSSATADAPSTSMSHTTTCAPAPASAAAHPGPDPGRPAGHERDATVEVHRGARGP